LEATGNTEAIARLLEQQVSRVVVSNPHKTRAIAEAKVKTDKVDAAVLAGLLAANYLPRCGWPTPNPRAPPSGHPPGPHRAPADPAAGTRCSRSSHRNLIGRCPAADLFGTKGRAWLATQDLPQTSTRRSRSCWVSSTSTARSCGSSTPNSAGSAWNAPRSAGC
jgi:transposase